VAFAEARRSRTLLRLAALAAAWLLASCSAGGGGDDAGALLASVGGSGCDAREKCVAPARPSSPGETLEIAAVEVVEKGFTLTAAGQQRPLSALVYDRRGNVVDVPVTWASSRPDVLALGPTGMATAGATTGITQVVAEVGGVRSAPVMALVAPVAPGAVLVDDGDVVGDPMPADPLAPTGPTNRYALTLRGPAPAVGAILVGTGSKPVAGRVLAVQTFGNEHRVTLEIVPLREMFPNLTFDETIDLSTAALVLPQGILADYDVSRQGSRVTFTPRPVATKRLRSAIPRVLEKAAGYTDPFADDGDPNAPPNPFERTWNPIGPIFCKGSATNLGDLTELFSIKTPPTYGVNFPLGVQIAHSAERGFERAVISGALEGSIEIGIGLQLGLQASLDCRVDAGDLDIPWPGPIGLAIGNKLKLSAGIKAEPKVTVASVGVGLKGTAARTGMQLGIACDQGDCDPVHTWGTFSASVEPTWDIPGDEFRVELPVQLYLRGVMKFGVREVSFLQMKLATIVAGPKMEGNFAPKWAQASDRNYKSSYAITVPASIELEGEQVLSAIAARLGVRKINPLSANFSLAVSGSPTGTVNVKSAVFATGERVETRVSFDAASVYALLGLGYTIDKVSLVHFDGNLTVTPLQEIVAQEGQTQFDFDFEAPLAGRSEQVFAFVTSRLLPSFLPLEVGSGLGPTVRGAGGTITGVDRTGDSPTGVISSAVTYFLLKLRTAEDRPPATPTTLSIKGPPGWNGGQPFGFVYAANRPWVIAGVQAGPITGEYTVSGSVGERQIEDKFTISAASGLPIPQDLGFREATLNAMRAGWASSADTKSASAYLSDGSAQVSERPFVPLPSPQDSLIDVLGFTTQVQNRLVFNLYLYNVDLTNPDIPEWPQQFNQSYRSLAYPTISMARVTAQGQNATDIYFSLSPAYIGGCSACVPPTAPIPVEWWAEGPGDGTGGPGAIVYPTPNGLVGRLVAFVPGRFTVTARWQQFPDFSVSMTVDAVPAPLPE
jgi:hypothetical protein